MKKSLVTCMAIVCLCLQTKADNKATWFRNSAISPDGKTIAFSYKGDIYTVDAQGGQARRLTSHPAYDGYPKWSPDSKSIAFASDRYGNSDIFVVSASGGKPKRLTTHSVSEVPEAFLDNGHILYSAAIMPDVKDLAFPGSFKQVWSVDTEGHRPVLFSSLSMESMSVCPANGAILYQNNKGYEDAWRKHHRSPITRDIYVTENHASGRTFKKLSTDNAEHRDPRWAPDGKSFWMVSEKDGTLNIWYNENGREIQVTHYKDYPVRYLSVANNGTLCYSWDGSLYTLAQGQLPVKVDISIAVDDDELVQQPKILTGQVVSFDVNKAEKEIVFSVNGDIYTKTMEYETTRRITSTPGMEALPCFSPDGRSIVYAAERNGKRNIYRSSLVNKTDKNFTYATDIKEEALTQGDTPCIMPKYSPDGKKIAFIANKTEIRMMDVKTRKVITVLPASYNFSYADGDFDFEWSPDSRWILTSTIEQGGWNNQDIAVVSIDGKRIINLTRSGYADGMPYWALGGKAIIWESDRAGYRSHGSWGAESDGYIMFLDKQLYALALMNKEDRELAEMRLKSDSTANPPKDTDKKKASAKDKKKNSSSAADSAKTDTVKPLQLDFDGCEDRVIRLTINSSLMGNIYLNNKGTKFYYTARYEGGYDLWVHDLEKNTTSIVKKNIGNGPWKPSAKGTDLYMLTKGTLSKLTLENGNVKPLPFKAEAEVQTPQQREFIFDHCVQQIENRFCQTDYHGVDFKALAAHYRRFLPEISNSRDFAEMVSELLGELNCSHTGLKYRGVSTSRPTAVLGAFYDASYEGDGLLIEEIIKDGPLDLPDNRIKAGMTIMSIDRQPIKKGEDYYPLLAGKADKWVLLTLTEGKGNKTFDVYVKPCSQGKQTGLLYKRWTRRAEETVRQRSNGKVGYVHIEGMNSPSFRKVFSDLLGKYRNCDAVVVDERHNGGGWLHEDLAVLFSGRKFQTFTSRGQYLGADPFNRWYKPSCVVMCENCYSNAHGFPYMYKELGLGKLVGTSMAGTMTAVWWENQVDPTLILGIPEVNCVGLDGKVCENQQLDPDIPAPLLPEDQLKGNDTQLNAAVDLMLKEINLSTHKK